MKDGPKIRILENGPYLVTENVPLGEKIITRVGNHYELRRGRNFPQMEGYALCRCGGSKTKPFCDGTHEEIEFNGEETASREKYRSRAFLFEGPGIDMLDDFRCAFARFCHREKGNAWELVEMSDDEECRNEAIKAASECIAGRLTAVEKKTGKEIEPLYKPSIDIIQDLELRVSGGIFVKGHIPIESSDGVFYEPRNRVTLCRCGKSSNKPFCDATHVKIKFKDGSPGLKFLKDPE